MYNETALSKRQDLDPELAMVIKYLQSGDLPADKRKATEIILGKSRYVLMDNVLYHLSAGNSLRIVLPKEDRLAVFKEVHEGKFTGHLRDAKIHSQLGKAYWWPKMHKGIVGWCRACETCASQQVSNHT